MLSVLAADSASRLSDHRARPYVRSSRAPRATAAAPENISYVQQGRGDARRELAGYGPTKKGKEYIVVSICFGGAGDMQRGAQMGARGRSRQAAYMSRRFGGQREHMNHVRLNLIG
jgi:hypothetical protein